MTFLLIIFIFIFSTRQNFRWGSRKNKK